MDPPIYKECMRNHAAKLGSYSTDGCLEYSPATDNRCAACGCHRSYHRRHDNLLQPPLAAASTISHPHFSNTNLSLRRVKQLARLKHHGRDQFDNNDGGGNDGGSGGGGEEERERRRRKSKFTEEQREAMREMAERLGWTLKDKRGKREEIGVFCDGIGVSRYLFKTWVNNNKRFYQF